MKIKKRHPSGAVTIKLTRDEIDAIVSITADLGDKNRNVVVSYMTDESDVVPTKRWRKTMKQFNREFSEDHGEYWYFDWFEEV